VKLDGCELPEALGRGAKRDDAGWWRIPIQNTGHVEQALAQLREAGAKIASLEVAEPELEEVFVKIMRQEAVAESIR